MTEREFAFHDGRVRLYPPYELGFMGKSWDGTGVAFRVDTWRLALAALKPGGHLVAFGAPRNAHRLALAIEDAGFEIRDSLMWLFGSGFPKSLDVSKAIDKAAGAERQVIPLGAPVKRMIPGADHNGGGWVKDDGREYQPGVSLPATDLAADWQGWGTALKPAYEPIILARKPLIGTVAQNVQAHGTGAMNIDGCRVDAEPRVQPSSGEYTGLADGKAFAIRARPQRPETQGRWPANIVHDGSEEVLTAFPGEAGGHEPRGQGDGRRPGGFGGVGAERGDNRPNGFLYGDSGSAARFFYTAKADANDRIGSKHPTVKPVDLMRWLCRLVTPKGGTILDPFAGTGTTGEAAFYEGFNAILIEREAEYVADIERRMKLVMAGPDERSRETVKARLGAIDAGPLFA